MPIDQPPRSLRARRAQMSGERTPQLAVMDAFSGPRSTARRPDGSALKLSILMPTYDEGPTIARAVRSVLETAYPCEIELIVVDDGSNDSTYETVAAMRDPRLRLLRHQANLGKGAALLTAAAVATGTHIIPFDADLEYVPEDIAKLLEPVIAGRCDIVYGARLFGVNTVYQSYRYALGNRALTMFANVLFDSYVSDLHTCLKLMPLALFRELDLHERGFGLDTELTARLLRTGLRPFEVPVSYHSRAHAHGKKISWLDGVQCLFILARVRFARVAAPASRPDEENLSALERDPVDPLSTLSDELDRRISDGGAAPRRGAAR